MPAIAKLGSLCSGHDGFPPRPSVSGQAPFVVNGIPAMASGDAFAPHVKPNNPPHGGVAIGSAKLTINGKPAALVGDPVSCGSVIVTGHDLLQVK